MIGTEDAVELKTEDQPEPISGKELDPLEQARRQATEETLRAVVDRIGNYADQFRGTTQAQIKNTPWARDLKPAETFYEQIQRFLDISLQGLKNHNVALIEDTGNPFNKITLNTNILIQQAEHAEAESDQGKQTHDVVVQQAVEEGDKHKRLKV